MKGKTALAALAALLFCAVALAGAGTESTQVTIYNQGIGLVRQTRSIVLKKGMNEISIGGLPSSLEPATVFLQFVNPQTAQVLEQSYYSGGAQPRNYLQRYLGEEVDVAIKDPVTGKVAVKKGKLVSTGLFFDRNRGKWFDSGQPIAQIGDKVYPVLPGDILYPPFPAGDFAFPPGAIARNGPALHCLVESQVAGSVPLSLYYISDGFSWTANYVALLNPEDNRLDLQGWVSATNNSGQSFHNAKLQVVAGTVNVAQAPRAYAMMTEGEAKAAEAAPQFAQTSSFEYHLYTLNRPATLLNGQTKALSFLSGGKIPVRKILIYDAAPGLMEYSDSIGYREMPLPPVRPSNHPRALLEFTNDKKSGLGAPFPEGTVMVYQEDSSGGMILAGEDRIEHTPKDEKVALDLGESFDVVGDRKEISWQGIIPHHEYDETIRIDLRNHKDEQAAVKVIEHLWRGESWQITQSSIPYKKLDARTIAFSVSVRPDGESAVTYTVRYSW